MNIRILFGVKKNQSVNWQRVGNVSCNISTWHFCFSFSRIRSNVSIILVVIWTTIYCMQNNMPNFCGLLCYLNLKYKVEKYVANQSFKWHTFEKQWSLLKNIFWGVATSTYVCNCIFCLIFLFYYFFVIY